MKLKNLLLLPVMLIVCISFLTGCGKKDSGTADKKDAKDVNITEATPYHVKYDIKGKESGTLDLYINGKNMKFEINAKQEGKDVKAEIFKTEDEMIVISSDESGKKIGFKMKLDDKTKNEMKDFTDIAKIKEQLKDYKKGGTENVLGYNCDVYTNDTAKICVYKDLVALKFETLKKDDSGETVTATAFEPDVKLANDFFTVPKDVQVTDMDELMKGMQDIDKSYQKK